MRALRRIAACLWLMALPFAAGPLHAAGQELTPNELRTTAARMLEAGRPDVALDLSAALLRRDPDDVQALLIRSRALRDTGDTRGARRTARRAMSLSGGNREVEFAASLAIAQAWSTEGRRTLAQFWLRRAVEYAPSPQARAMAERDYRYVRSRNRWSTQLAFSIAPKSNINNGTVHDSAFLYGLPFELSLPGATQALSGLEIAAGGTARYRLRETRTSATDLLITGWHQTYILSDAAKAKAPGASGSDFATTTISLGFDQRYLVSRARTEVSFGGRAGRYWLGGDHYGDFLRGTAGLKHGLSRDTVLSFGLSAERTVGPTAPHATSIDVSAVLSRRLANGARLDLSVAATQSVSNVDVADYRQIRIGAGYAPPRPILGARTIVGVDWRLRDFDVSAFAPGKGRRDTELTGYLDLTFEKVDYYGFNPTVTLRASRQNSTVDLFDIDRFGVQLGFRSAF